MKPPAFNGIWRDDVRARAAYSEGAGVFRILPRAVAIPSTTRAVVDLVRWASAEGIPIIPRGAGSGMPGGNVGDGLILDLTVLDGAPIAIDRDRCLAPTSAATTLGTLHWAAEPLGLRMPVDPSSERWVTSGGAVSTNAAGSRTVKYGSVRRWVESLTVVTADAEVVRLDREKPAPPSALTDRVAAVADTLRLARWRVASSFPKVRKSTAGYGLDAYLESGDLLDLMIGAEGTLGVVTGVVWRLEPIPPFRVGLRAALRDSKRLSHVVPALLELEPSRLEFLDASFLQFVGDALRALPRGARLSEAGALLMVELEGGERGVLDGQLERAVGILRAESIEVAVGHDDAELDVLWSVRHTASPKLAALGDERRSLQIIEDAAVPVHRLGDYLAAVQSITARHQIPVVMFGHAGDGNVHANLLPDVTKPGWEERVRAVFDEVTQAVIALGGSPSGEHGDGRLRSGLAERVFGFEVSQIFRAIKRAFDPAAIMNPGVKLGDPGVRLGPFKVGSSAPPIPVEIEQGLRRIERTAGYAVARLAVADGL